MSLVAVVVAASLQTGWTCKGPERKHIGKYVYLQSGEVRCRFGACNGHVCFRRDPVQIMRAVWHDSATQAVRIAWCEGSLNPWAGNGQYQGTFQMGSGERKRWGHGKNLWAQARAAKDYSDYSLRVSGYRWGPWQCRPERK